MIVDGYARVSTDEQAETGVSLADQAKKIRRYAADHGLDLAELIDDQVSAKTLDRPGLARALARLDAGETGGLVVAKLDRLTRSVLDFATLLDRYFGPDGRLRLFSHAEPVETRTATGRLQLYIQVSVSQWERETIVERTQSAMTHKRETSERISGRLPYGMDLGPDGKTLVPNPVERARIELIGDLAAHGSSPRQVASHLNGLGFPAKGGGRWNESSVRAILKRHPIESEAAADGTQAG